MKFGESDGNGGIHKGGRPTGVRNKLPKNYLQDVFDHWNEPVSSTNPTTRGKAALSAMFKEDPPAYVRNYGHAAAMLIPKEFHLQTAASELDDDELKMYLAEIGKRIAAASEQPMKVIEHQPEKADANGRD
jgi:hypothetical protein